DRNLIAIVHNSPGKSVYRNSAERVECKYAAHFHSVAGGWVVPADGPGGRGRGPAGADAGGGCVGRGDPGGAGTGGGRRSGRDGGPTTLPAMEITLKQSTANPLWQKKRQQIHNAVTSRLDQARQRLSETPAASSATAPPPPVSSPSWDDPRWQPYFYGPNDAL